MKKYFNVDGVVVEYDGPSGKEYKHWRECQNEHITDDMEITKKQATPMMEEEVQKEEKRVKRVKRLELLEDAVHALLMQHNHDRLEGKDLVEPLDDILGKWLHI